MAKYILLADIEFDWSAGEYDCQNVDSVFLGVDEFETGLEAQNKADKLFEEYADSHYRVMTSGSCAYIQKID